MSDGLPGLALPFGPPAAEPLAGLARPVGTPGSIRATAQNEADTAARLSTAAEDMQADGRLVLADWTGTAAMTFASHIDRLFTETLRTAVAHAQAGATLRAWAEELQAAQNAYDEAEAIGVLAMAQEQLGLQERQRRAAAPGVPVAGRLPPIVSPLRAVARKQAEAAVLAAETAAQACAEKLHALTPQLPPACEQPKGGLWRTVGHTILDGAGLVPLVGEPADLLNAGWYELDGNHLDAGLSAAGAIPFLGWGATAAKDGRKAFKAGERIAEGLEAAGKTGDDALDAARAAQEFARLRAVPGDSRKLRRALEAAGLVAPVETDAHHIVAGGARLADESRNILARLGIDINSAPNGVFLPSNKTSIGAGLGPSTHRSLHTPEYHQAVLRALERAQTREDALEILDVLRTKLNSGWAPRR